MIQLIPFNQDKGGNTANFCLLNVIKGYSIPRKYDSAWEAWLHTQEHVGEPPAGLDVPVFFSYWVALDNDKEPRNYGHIGVRLANGQFWSDGRVYSSIQAYTNNHAPKYVGWGESVNDVKVIGGENMKPTSDQVASFYQASAGRQPTKQELETAVGLAWPDWIAYMEPGLQATRETVTRLENDRDTNLYPKINTYASGLGVSTNSTPDQIKVAFDKLGKGYAQVGTIDGQPIYRKD